MDHFSYQSIARIAALGAAGLAGILLAGDASVQRVGNQWTGTRSGVESLAGITAVYIQAGGAVVVVGEDRNDLSWSLKLRSSGGAKHVQQGLDNVRAVRRASTLVLMAQPHVRNAEITIALPRTLRETFAA